MMHLTYFGVPQAHIPGKLEVRPATSSVILLFTTDEHPKGGRPGYGEILDNTGRDTELTDVLWDGNTISFSQVSPEQDRPRQFVLTQKNGRWYGTSKVDEMALISIEATVKTPKRVLLT